MAWTTPRTWAHDDLAAASGAASLNTHLSDNINWLKSGNWAVDTAATPSTTSTSAVAITGLSVSLTTTGGNCLMVLVGSIRTTVGVTLTQFQWRIDTVQVGSTQQVHTVGANLSTPLCLWYFTSTPPSAASHTFTVYWQTAANTLSADANTLRLFVWETF